MELTKLQNPNYKFHYVGDQLVIEAVPMDKFRMALESRGLTSSVDSYVSTLPAVVQKQFEYATTIHRNSEHISAAVTGLFFTNEQINAVFIDAFDI